MNTLVTPLDLIGFPIDPQESVLDAAVAAVRRDAGWHIAPVVTETVRVDAQGGVLLMLPTMRLVNVTAVRDYSDPLLPVTLTGWQVSRAGMLYRPLGWPLGFSVVEVDMVHGYQETPPDLLAVVAEYCQRAQFDVTVTQRTRTVGAVSEAETYRSDVGGLNTSPALARYTLPPRQ